MMKSLHLLLFSLAGLILAVFSASAQQAKAYENVRYVACQQGMVFQLYYAGGYIGASKIKLKQQQKTVVLVPESGMPDEDGNFVFYPASVSDRRKVVLAGINEDAIAPQTIRGTYKTKGRVTTLVFIKSKM
jgi:hypothetical protein